MPPPISTGHSMTDVAEELYFVKTKDTQRPNQWKRVDVAVFANEDAQAYFGTMEAVKAQISVAEDIPPELISGYGDLIHLSCDAEEHLETAMEYTRRSGAEVPCHFFTRLYGLRKTLPGRKVVCIGYGQYVIDKRWTIGSRSSLAYSPDAAQAKLAEREVEKSARPKHVYCTIPCRGLLADMFNHLVWPIRKLKACHATTGCYRHYYFVDIYYPHKRRTYLDGIPAMASFRRHMKLRTYRTKAWWKWIGVLLEKHMNDPLMKGDFKGFIEKEAKARPRSATRSKR